MRRNGFTMVELIFVIIIIGILSVAALPKFGDIKDRAKVNNEYSALSALDGAIEGAIAFHQEDHNDMAVRWHGENKDSSLDLTPANAYPAINTAKKVLSKIVKKGDTLQVVGFIDLNATGTATDGNTTYDVLFIEGEASNHTTGVRKDEDTPGKPDKNDVWVFNTSPYDITIEERATEGVKSMKVISGEMKLLDCNKTSQQALDITQLVIKGGDNGTTDIGSGGTPGITKVN